ncbi:MAG: ArnT family glycosyltransferase, partial [Vampirovibrionia bacterium]
FNSYKKKEVIESCSTEENGKKCSACIFVNLFKRITTPIINTYKDTDIESKLTLFALIWFITIFSFFTSSGTKLLTYILPLFPALALIMGKLWYDYIENKNDIKNKYMIISCSLLVVMFLIISYLIVFQFNSLMPRDAKVLDLGNIRLYGGLILSIGSISALICIIKNQKAYSLYSLVTMIVLIAVVALYGIVPKVNNAAQGHLNKLIHVANNYPGGQYVISTYGLVKPSIVFYTKRSIEHIEPHEEGILEKKLNNDDRIFIITRVRFLDELSKNSNVYIIDVGRRFALFTNKPFDEKITKKLLKGKNQ